MSIFMGLSYTKITMAQTNEEKNSRRRDDVELIRKCQQGDSEALKKLVQKYQEKAVWIAYQMVGNFEEARDISQEAFIRVYRSIHKFNLMSNFYTWLYRIVINLCIDYLRKQGQRARPVSIDDVGDVCAQPSNIERRLEKEELSVKIYKVLEKVPPKYRSILILRDIEDYDCKEVATILDCNHNTVRWRLFRGRQIFKEIWEKQEGVESPI